MQKYSRGLDRFTDLISKTELPSIRIEANVLINALDKDILNVVREQKVAIIRE